MASPYPIQKTLSYLTFQAPGVRLGVELSLCFVLFEFFSAATSEPGKLLFIWFGACSLVAALDWFIFFPLIKRLEMARRFSYQGRVEEALLCLTELNEALPLPYFHLQRARVYADNSRFIEATQELRLARKVSPAEECARVELDILRAQGEFEAAATRLKASESPEQVFELAVTRFEEGHSQKSYGVDRDCLREAARLFEEVGKKAANLQALTELYSQSCSLWLGRAEEAFPKLIRDLRTLPLSTDPCSPLNRHLGRLYLSRAYYALTHGERLLGASDHRLGSALLPPVQLKQLKAKIGEELGEIRADNATNPNNSDMFTLFSDR
jgi:tetratricopeptide (TPR) repeat protein